MKQILTIVLSIIGLNLYAQTNTFPLSDNVGIGTLSPITPLQIKGSTTLGLKYVPTKAFLNITNGTSSLLIDNNEIYSDGNLHFGASKTGKFYFGGVDANSSTIHMMINNSNGNVGIGTSSPNSILDLNMGASGDAILTIESDTDNAGSEADNARIEMYQDGRLIGVKIGFNEDTGTPANHFQIDMINPGGVSDNAFTIHPYNGKIGLGILATSEDARLVVNGNILAEEIKVQNVPSSDYVFEHDYDLRSIKEVEAFVKAYGHLPDIPSAEEFKENGVGLGEMDNMLLMKVEELMLYVIELKKENEAMKAKNKEMDELKAMVKAFLDEK